MAIFIQYNNSHDLETHTDRLQYAQKSISEPFFIIVITILFAKQNFEAFS